MDAGLIALCGLFMERTINFRTYSRSLVVACRLWEVREATLMLNYDELMEEPKYLHPLFENSIICVRGRARQPTRLVYSGINGLGLCFRGYLVWILVRIVVGTVHDESTYKYGTTARECVSPINCTINVYKVITATCFGYWYWPYSGSTVTRGPPELLCGASNVGKIWSACGQRGAQLRRRKYACNDVHTFTCVLFCTSCAKNMLIVILGTRQEL